MKRVIFIFAVSLIIAILGIALFFYLTQYYKEADQKEENQNWVNEIINGTKVYDRWDQYEASISKCIYDSQVAYYITYSGDDLYNDLFSTDGEKICSPDGGFSGNGDGQCSDFSASKNDCQLIWKKAT